MHLPSKFFNSDHDLKSEELKPTGVSNRASPSGNLGTNLELHTPKSIPKKPKGDGGDMKKKLELDKVIYKNEA
jgi:hypothetical protein